MGYSIRDTEYRYTAWFQWDGINHRPVTVTTPINGTHGFYNELYNYSGVDDDAFDTLERAEVAPLDPERVARMHADLLKMIQDEA